VADQFLNAFRDLYERSAVAFNEGDLEAAVDGLPEDFEWQAPAEDPDHDVQRGPAEIVAWFAEMRSLFEDWRMELRQVERLSEGAILVHHVITGKSRGAGVPVAVDTWEVWEFEGGVPRRARQFFSRPAALDAAAG
jgi:ketosteroid isomerase-like protein